MEQALDLGSHLVQRRPQVLEHVGRDAFTLDQQPEQQVLGAYVVVAHPARLFEGNLDDFLHARGRDDLLDDDPLIAPEHRLDRLADLADLYAKVVEDLGGEAFTFPEQSQQEMFGPDVAVV